MTRSLTTMVKESTAVLRKSRKGQSLGGNQNQHTRS